MLDIVTRQILLRELLPSYSSMTTPNLSLEYLSRILITRSLNAVLLFAFFMSLSQKGTGGHVDLMNQYVLLGQVLWLAVRWWILTDLMTVLGVSLVN